MSKEKNFQKTFIKHLNERDLQVIELSDLMNPGGKPDLMILGQKNYFYCELKVHEFKFDFMLRTPFQPTQLPYYYKFLRSQEWSLYVIIRITGEGKGHGKGHPRGYEVIRMERKLIKEILAGLKYRELATKWYCNSNFFTDYPSLITYIKEEMRTPKGEIVR